MINTKVRGRKKESCLETGGGEGVTGGQNCITSE